MGAQWIDGVCDDDDARKCYLVLVKPFRNLIILAAGLANSANDRHRVLSMGSETDAPFAGDLQALWLWLWLWL